LWSDGTPFTANDVVFTANYCMDPDTGCAQLTNFLDVENVEAVDDLTVKVTFGVAKPFPYGPFVGAVSPIIQEAQFAECVGAAAQECTDANFGPIGTGPFVVEEFRPNDAVLYVANENYRDANKPYFGELFLKGGGDAAAAARAVLETGEADYGWNLQVEPEILSQMELAGNGKVVSAFGANVERIMVNQTNNRIDGDDRSEYMDGNNQHPFFSNPVVPQAMSMAINRGVLTQVGYGQAGKPTCNVLPAPAIYASTANDGCLVQDIEGAKALLDEAGIVDSDGDGIREIDGEPISILYQTSTNGVRQATQALVKQWWAEIGIETELRNIDASVFFGGDPASPDTYGKFYADVEMYTNGFSGTDPEIYMSSWACSEISGADNNWLGNNVPRYCNPEYDKLVEEMSKTADIDARAELAKKMNDFLVNDYAMIPLIHRGSVSAHANSLLGVRMNAWDSELWNVADWSRSGN
ncbi:MAG TPA: peptide ABC transporter substrate-binding protein, partial [Gammaproteobacteria bacterium]|nr:peptide ABC transporter substrate-binding protein [Gammaproteobacteria bacterium]